MRILVFAPHPDDEVLGCGGFMARASALGDEVFTCIVTKAYEPDWDSGYIANQRKTVLNAGRILGTTETLFLDFPTVKLDTIPKKEFNEAVSRCVRDIGPDVIVAPHYGDVNFDHGIVFDAVMVAIRPTPNNSVRRLMTCEIPSETDWAVPSKAFIPNVYVDISTTLRKKLDAMRAYETELKAFPNTRSLAGIATLAIRRGAEIGVNAAEAFALVREIEKDPHNAQTRAERTGGAR